MWQFHPVEGKTASLELKQNHHLCSLTSRTSPCCTEPPPATPTSPDHNPKNSSKAMDGWKARPLGFLITELRRQTTAGITCVTNRVFLFTTVLRLFILELQQSTGENGTVTLVSDGLTNNSCVQWEIICINTVL